MKRTKVCKACGTRFEPVRFAQVVCNDIKCALTYGKVKGDKLREKKRLEEKRADRERKVKSKTLTEWLDEAQVWVNRYIRLRDQHLPCISCGTVNPKIQYAAGHYRTRKAASHLRFNHDNLHKQCNHRCNQQLSGNIANYRPALIEKIGIERVEALENDNRVHRWTIDEAKAIIAEHKRLIKELENETHVRI